MPMENMCAFTQVSQPVRCEKLRSFVRSFVRSLARSLARSVSRSVGRSVGRLLLLLPQAQQL